ncbi:MAG: Gfo/Idh/MocA family oxidoreductase [Rhizobiales bacterium]|nr:Gfo/Idh/MocA family oxidoreductase [Hyphomicrobiales bacterium]MBN9010544.1 Gfo/Idh/MocA family oxidoreductase [Hyphomicrobiales bacterium]
MADKVRIAVAGAGRFGREHIRTLAGMDDVAIAGIAEPDEAARRDVAAAHDVETAAADIGDILERTKPDGLVIASPAHTHVQIACMALARNIPILLEKPVGMSVADADLLIAAEKASRGFVLPGHILRFAAPYRTTIAIAQSGEIGDILSVSARNHRDDSHAARYPDIDPVLMTMIHDIDLAIWATGSVLASVLACRCPPETFRSETLVLGKDARGCLWQMSNAWTYPTLDAPPDRLEIVCDQGSVELEFGSRIRVSGKHSRSIDLKAAAPDNELRNELAAFVAGVRAGTHPGVVTLAEARLGLIAAEAIVRSFTLGEMVRP